MAKKKKRSPEQMHRQVQDSLQALPYAIAEHQKQGRKAKALMLRYVSSPMLRLMNRVLNAQRYRGSEGKQRQQSEKMRRHLEQKQAAIRHVQGSTQPQKRKKKAK